MTDATTKTVKTSRARRKEARPGEIVEIALACFLDNGFEATKLDDVAKRAGVAKGTLYVYFETKEHLFRAVVDHVMAGSVKGLVASAAIPEGPLEVWLPNLMQLMVDRVSNSKAPAFARLIMQEAGRFPDLAKIWFDAVAFPLLGAFTAAILAGQQRGEIRAGDPQTILVSVVGPLIVGMVSRELLKPIGVELVDLTDLATQHAAIIVQGLKVPPSASAQMSIPRGSKT